MKRFLILLVTLIMSVSMCIHISAEEVLTIGASEQPRLIDDAGLLTDSEIEKLSERLDSISEEHKVDFVIMTVIDSSVYEIENYMRSICLDYGYGYGDTNDCVMVMVNLGTRKFRVVSYGLAAEAISIDSCDDIEIEMESDLSNGDYYDAFEIFIKESEYLINGHINGFPFKLAQNLLISIGIGLVVALIATLVMKSQLKSVKEQKTANLYTRHGSMNLRVQNDLFLYSTVTRVKIQKTSSGSSSGGSRGGGGRSF